MLNKLTLQLFHIFKYSPNFKYESSLNPVLTLLLFTVLLLSL